MAAITGVYAREILDSRGNPTIEVEVAAGSVDLLTGKSVTTADAPATVLVPAGDVAVVREPR